MPRIGIIFGDEKIDIAHSEKGVLHQDLAYVNWDEKTKTIISFGSQAKKELENHDNPYKVIRLFKNGSIVDYKIFDQFFEKVFLPLKADFKDSDLVFGVPFDENKEDRKHLETLLKDYGLKSISFVPNIILLAIGAGANINDDYGTIILHLGHNRIAGGIIADNQLVNFKTLPYAEDHLDREISIFFKEKFHIIIRKEEIDHIKYHIASLTSTKYDVQSLVSGQDLLTNKPKEVLVKDSDVKKIFLNLFSGYRSVITSLLESAPPYVRTGVAKNGLIVTGDMSKIHGIEDYFSAFFEFPTIVNNQLTNYEAVKGFNEIDLSIEKTKAFK